MIRLSSPILMCILRFFVAGFWSTDRYLNHNFCDCISKCLPVSLERTTNEIAQILLLLIIEMLNPTFTSNFKFT